MPALKMPKKSTLLFGALALFFFIVTAALVPIPWAPDQSLAQHLDTVSILLFLLFFVAFPLFFYFLSGMRLSGFLLAYSVAFLFGTWSAGLFPFFVVAVLWLFMLYCAEVAHRTRYVNALSVGLIACALVLLSGLVHPQSAALLVLSFACFFIYPPLAIFLSRVRGLYAFLPLAKPEGSLWGAPALAVLLKFLSVPLLLFLPRKNWDYRYLLLLFLVVLSFAYHPQIIYLVGLLLAWIVSPVVEEWMGSSKRYRRPIVFFVLLASFLFQIVL